MKLRLLPIASVWLVAMATASAQTFPLSEKSLESAFAGKVGALVLIDCATGIASPFNPKIAAEKFPPCSTFKIWNTLIGLENGILHSANEPFYKWDGQKRFLPEWNQDLTLKQAFQYSCVPAYQELARKIGPKRMQLGLDKINYGDRNISAGIDVFWLPAPDRKTILISPIEQAELIARLVNHKLPVSEPARAVLKEVMFIQKTDQGAFYGKTGTGTDGAGNYVLGWFVGYVETSGKTYAFACLQQGSKVMGKDARAIVETVLKANGYW